MLRVSALVLVVAVAGCDGGSLTWSISFEDSAQASSAEVVVASIRRGGCSGETIYSTDVRRGEDGPEPPELDEGTYGFAARARNGSCEAIAAGCVEVTVPDSETANVSLATFPSPSTDCDATECTNGVCGERPEPDAGMPDAGGRDSGSGCQATETSCRDGVDEDCDELTDCADPDCAGDLCCTGCIQDMACMAGDQPEACGVGGVACATCGACERCQTGAGGTTACQPLDVGDMCVGASGTCHGDPRVCCTGCWDNTTSACVSGNSSTACGAGGVDCQACGGSDSCNSGVCGGCAGPGATCVAASECCAGLSCTASTCS